ncbi:hypothetical protein E4U41_002205 [Claviceps citrina]|nr:hypothetical protein E4U41_002205 [Claviceps citrina]
MAEAEKPPRCPEKRLLKPPPSTTSTHVTSSKAAKADVRYLLPADQPRAVTWPQETVRINTADVAQPFLDADALPSFRS